MGAPAHSRDPFGPVPFGHEEVLRGPSKKAVRDGALVLQAAGIQHAIQASGAGARIVVGLLDAERARVELGDYLEENQAWPPLKERPPSFGTNGLPSALLFAAVIAVMHWMQYRGGYGVDWTSAGRMEGGAVASGEGWRAITAPRFTWISKPRQQPRLRRTQPDPRRPGSRSGSRGWGPSWPGSSGTRSSPSSWIRPTGHRRVHRDLRDLGLMTAAEWTRRGRGDAPWVRRVRASAGPCSSAGSASATARAAWTCSRTTGFLSGALIGWTVARTRLPERLGRGGQGLLGLGAICVLVLGWALALGG